MDLFYDPASFFVCDRFLHITLKFTDFQLFHFYFSFILQLKLYHKKAYNLI